MLDSQQTKSWADMSEDERQAVKESWKVKLPDEFDVFCEGNMRLDQNTFIPGNMYVHGNILACNIGVAEHLYVTGNVYCNDISASAGITIKGNVDCYDIFLNGDLAISGNIDCFNIFATHSEISIDGKSSFYLISVKDSF